MWGVELLRGAAAVEMWRMVLIQRRCCGVTTYLRGRGWKAGAVTADGHVKDALVTATLQIKMQRIVPCA